MLPWGRGSGPGAGDVAPGQGRWPCCLPLVPRVHGTLFGELLDVFLMVLLWLRAAV